MTLGQKLAAYRKLAGMTQQQLGDRLNISAQAISKWEKDLTEPALATLRVLADLYKVSVDILLDPDAPLGVPVPTVDEEGDLESEPTITPHEDPPPAPIGFCKRCGITVTQENVGSTSPTVLCKNCAAAVERERVQRISREEAERHQREQQKKRQLEANRSQRRYTRTKSFWVAGIITAVFLAIMILARTTGFSVGLLFTTLIGSYVVFAFVSCMFYDCIVQDVVLDWMSKSFNAPGLIFTFDLDGCLWLIGMKLLFWAIGLLFSIVVGIIGITLGLICAPFVFPYLMAKEAAAIRSGSAPE